MSTSKMKKIGIVSCALAAILIGYFGLFCTWTSCGHWHWVMLPPECMGDKFHAALGFIAVWMLGYCLLMGMLSMVNVNEEVLKHVLKQLNKKK